MVGRCRPSVHLQLGAARLVVPAHPAQLVRHLPALCESPERGRHRGTRATARDGECRLELHPQPRRGSSPGAAPARRTSSPPHRQRRRHTLYNMRAGYRRCATARTRCAGNGRPTGRRSAATPSAVGRRGCLVGRALPSTTTSAAGPHGWERSAPTLAQVMVVPSAGADGRARWSTGGSRAAGRSRADKHVHL